MTWARGANELGVFRRETNSIDLETGTTEVAAGDYLLLGAIPFINDGLSVVVFIRNEKRDQLVVSAK